MRARGILSQSQDTTILVAEDSILVIRFVPSLVVEDVSVLVYPCQAVAVKVDESHVFENSVPGGTILVPDYVDLFLLFVSGRFQLGRFVLSLQAKKVTNPVSGTR